VDNYYRIISNIKSQIEVFQDSDWSDLSIEKIHQMVREYDSFSRSLSFGQLPAYSYLIYLRHHGFPSPLLDWSRSLYVAAYYAFESQHDGDAAIYAYIESPNNMKARSSGRPELYLQGPNIKTRTNRSGSLASTKMFLPVMK
jgi:hypothetical protein